MRFRLWSVLLALAMAVGVSSIASAQTSAPAAPASSGMSSSSTGDGRVGIAVQASTLGIGGDIAVKLSDKANIRAGLNNFSWSHDFVDDKDGSITTAKVKLKSVHAFLDWFPFGGGFHLSPGMVFANDTNGELSLTATPGQKIEIGDVNYYSSSTNPIRAAGKVTVKSSAFAMTMGWGNIVPRTRHWSIPFEIGVVFQERSRSRGWPARKTAGIAKTSRPTRRFRPR